MLSGLLLGLVLLLLCWGWIETWRVRVIEARYVSSRVPREFSGYRIVLIGGLHLRRSSGWTRKISRITASLQPDLILLGGNVKPTHKTDNVLVHRLLSEFFQGVSPPDGILAVRGYRDRKRFWDEVPAESTVRVLNNETVRVERGGESIHIAGIQSAHACHLDRGINQLRETLEGVGEDDFVVLLGQSGDLLRVSQGLPVDLILALDNLHYQMRIPGLGVVRRDSKSPMTWARGWIREGAIALYLNPGLGTRWIPFRFFLRPELTVIELVSSPASE